MQKTSITSSKKRAELRRNLQIDCQRELFAYFSQVPKNQVETPFIFGVCSGIDHIRLVNSLEQLELLVRPDDVLPPPPAFDGSDEDYPAELLSTVSDDFSLNLAEDSVWKDFFSESLSKKSPSRFSSLYRSSIGSNRSRCNKSFILLPKKVLDAIRTYPKGGRVRHVHLDDRILLGCVYDSLVPPQLMSNTSTSAEDSDKGLNPSFIGGYGLNDDASPVFSMNSLNVNNLFSLMPSNLSVAPPPYSDEFIFDFYNEIYEGDNFESDEKLSLSSKEHSRNHQDCCVGCYNSISFIKAALKIHPFFSSNITHCLHHMDDSNEILSKRTKYFTYLLVLLSSGQSDLKSDFFHEHFQNFCNKENHHCSSILCSDLKHNTIFAQLHSTYSQTKDNKEWIVLNSMNSLCPILTLLANSFNSVCPSCVSQAENLMIFLQILSSFVKKTFSTPPQLENEIYGFTTKSSSNFTSSDEASYVDSLSDFCFVHATAGVDALTLHPLSSNSTLNNFSQFTQGAYSQINNNNNHNNIGISFTTDDDDACSGRNRCNHYHTESTNDVKEQTFGFDKRHANLSPEAKTVIGILRYISYRKRYLQFSLFNASVSFASFPCLDHLESFKDLYDSYEKLNQVNNKSNINKIDNNNHLCSFDKSKNIERNMIFNNFDGYESKLSNFHSFNSIESTSDGKTSSKRLCEMHISFFDPDEDISLPIYPPPTLSLHDFAHIASVGVVGSCVPYDHSFLRGEIPMPMNPTVVELRRKILYIRRVVTCSVKLFTLPPPPFHPWERLEDRWVDRAHAVSAFDALFSAVMNSNHSKGVRTTASIPVSTPCSIQTHPNQNCNNSNINNKLLNYKNESSHISNNSSFMNKDMKTVGTFNELSSSNVRNNDSSSDFSRNDTAKPYSMAETIKPITPIDCYFIPSPLANVSHDISSNSNKQNIPNIMPSMFESSAEQHILSVNQNAIHSKRDLIHKKKNTFDFKLINPSINNDNKFIIRNANTFDSNTYAKNYFTSNNMNNNHAFLNTNNCAPYRYSNHKNMNDAPSPTLSSVVFSSNVMMAPQLHPLCNNSVMNHHSSKYAKSFDSKKNKNLVRSGSNKKSVHQMNLCAPSDHTYITNDKNNFDSMMSLNEIRHQQVLPLSSSFNNHNVYLKSTNSSNVENFAYSIEHNDQIRSVYNNNDNNNFKGNASLVNPNLMPLSSSSQRSTNIFYTNNINNDIHHHHPYNQDDRASQSLSTASSDIMFNRSGMFDGLVDGSNNIMLLNTLTNGNINASLLSRNSSISNGTYTNMNNTSSLEIFDSGLPFVNNKERTSIETNSNNLGITREEDYISLRGFIDKKSTHDTMINFNHMTCSYNHNEQTNNKNHIDHHSLPHNVNEIQSYNHYKYNAYGDNNFSIEKNIKDSQLIQNAVSNSLYWQNKETFSPDSNSFSSAKYKSQHDQFQFKPNVYSNVQNAYINNQLDSNKVNNERIVDLNNTPMTPVPNVSPSFTANFEYNGHVKAHNNNNNCSNKFTQAPNLRVDNSNLCKRLSACNNASLNHIHFNSVSNSDVNFNETNEFIRASAVPLPQMNTATAHPNAHFITMRNISNSNDNNQLTVNQNYGLKHLFH